MQEYVAMWKNYFNFGGRTTRRGFWMAMLIHFIITAILSVIVGVLPSLAFLVSIYSLAILIPNLAIQIRRLRDAGKSWGWIFINLVPLVGQIVYLVFLCQRSVPAASANAGSDPYAN